MNGFTYFSSYHKALRKLPDNLRLLLHDAIDDYMFEGKEPAFEDATAAAMFELMRPNLNRSKKNGKNGEADVSQDRTEIESESNQNRIKIESESNQNRTEIKTKKRPSEEKEKKKNKDLDKDLDKDKDLDIPPKSPQGEKGLTAAEMIEAKHYPSVLESAVKNWVQYKIEKREGYRPMGLKSLLTEIENNANRYGDAAVIDVINKSMAAGYMGITWAWLRNARASPDPYQGIRDWLQEGSDDTEGVFDARRSDEGGV